MRTSTLRVVMLLGLMPVSLLSSLGVAAPPPTEKRVAALILPMDEASEQKMLSVESYAAEALGAYSGFLVRSTDDLFGIAPDEEANAAFRRAETGYKESKAAFDERSYEEAERKLTQTIKEYGKAVAAMKSCGNLCDAVAMYAATLQARGEAEEARIVLIDLLALNPTFELDRKRYPQNFLSLKAQVALGRNAQLRGNVVVKSKPSGARVYLDGQLQGFSPITLQTLPIGKHLLRIERPGFKQYGTLVEATPEDQEVAPELVGTTGYKAYDALMDRLAGEALKDKGGQSMSSIAKSLKLDRAVIGVLRETEGGSTELTMTYFDVINGTRLAIKRATFQGDEFGQLKGEVGRMVNHLLNTNDAEPTARSKDPLENKSGAEDWSGDDVGGRGKNRNGKYKGGDPLDSTSGTEDW